MPRPVNYPNTFGALSGKVSASLIDQNFNASGAVFNDSAAGWSNTAIDTGSVNNYVVALTPPASGLHQRLFVVIRAAQHEYGPQLHQCERPG